MGAHATQDLAGHATHVCCAMTRAAPSFRFSRGLSPMTIEAKTLFLADVLRHGLWTRVDLVRSIRGTLKLSAKGHWVENLARELVLVFAPNAPRPRIEALRQYLIANVHWLGYVREHRRCKLSTLFKTTKVRTPIMLPAAGAAETWNVAPLETPGRLADWLGLTCRELDWFADCSARLQHEAAGPRRHYEYRWVPKRRGGHRLLEIPKYHLKNIQRQLLENILDEIPPHATAHAYRRGRSIASYLAPHSGQEMVIHFDLRDFFTSIRWPEIDAIFRTAGYPESVARLLTGLCLTLTPLEVFRAPGIAIDPYRSAQATALRLAHLPQGAPTSPALANLAAYRLDCRLAGLASKMGFQYTRYADDLVFSGTWPHGRRMAAFQTLVRTILQHEGFSMHDRKTRVMTSATSQSVSGVTLNERLNLPREEYDQLKAQLFNCVRFGPASQNRDGHAHFRDHLHGRIAYWTLINPHRGGKLRAIFDRIDWSANRNEDE
jgi:RNA-directed DNA polymerase